MGIRTSLFGKCVGLLLVAFFTFAPAPFLSIRAEEIEEIIIEDTESPIFHLKDVTRDENESAPDYSEFININPESLSVSCTGLEGVDMRVDQPHANRLVLVTCMVEDEAGNQTTSQASLIINNVQPQVVIIAMPSTTVNSGESITLVGNISRGNGHFSYYWYGDCSGSGSGAIGLTNYVNVGFANGSHLCGINVTDSDGDVTAASVELQFNVISLNSPVNSTPAANTESSTEPTTPSTDVPSETQSTDDSASVEGVSTDQPASNPEESNENSNSTDTNNTTSTASAATSPLVIICLVAGGILIIGLLLFLFFRGEDEDEEKPTAAA